MRLMTTRRSIPAMLQAASMLLLGLFLVVTNVKCTPLNQLGGHTRSEASNGKFPIKHVFRENCVAQRSGHAFVIGSRASPEVTHDVIFVVKHKNLDDLARILDDTSDPLSSRYGKHMTREEIADLTSNPDSCKSVQKYLIEHGATVISTTKYGEQITARAPIHIWEEMFKTEFHAYSYSLEGVQGNNSSSRSTKKDFVRTAKYYVPGHLDEHVESVFNTVQMPMIRHSPKISTSTSVSTRLLAVTGHTTPAVLNKAYHISSNKGHPRATQAVYESLDQYFSPADLTQFEKYFSLPVVPVNTSIGGHSTTSAYCNGNPNACAEGSLDVQYMMAISQSPTTYYYYDNIDSFASFLSVVLDSASPPLVISISYGADEIGVSSSEMNYFNVQAMKLGLMGVTIVVASGDDGALSPYARGQPANCGYVVSYPASSPYVVAVGATMVSCS
jgi:tripeptidyl-peptidase I